MSGFARGLKRRNLKEQIEGFKTLFKESQPFVKAIEKLKEAKQEGYIAGYKARLLEEKQEAAQALIDAETAQRDAANAVVFAENIKRAEAEAEVEVVNTGLAIVSELAEPTLDVSNDHSQHSGSPETQEQTPVN